MKAILINTTFQIGHHGCTLVDRQIDQLASACGLVIAAKLPLHADWSTLAPRYFDLVLVNGEGGLHHDSKAAKRIADVPSWASERGRPAFLFNSVYEANGPDIAAGVARYDAIFVRDEYSRAALGAAGIPSAVVPDLALGWSPPAKGGTGRAIVVTDSTLRETNAQLHAFARAIGARFLPLMARPPRPLVDVHADLFRWSRYVSKRFASFLAPPGLWRDRWRGLIPGFEDFVAWLTDNAGLIIAGRFHGLCLALDLEIPVLAVPSNTRKIEGVLEAAALQSRLVENLDLLRHRLAQEGPEAFAYSDDEVAKLRSFRTRAAVDANRMFEMMHEHAEGTLRRKH
ncbi:MAG: polysaccharide pyruvyl transferase family protein [Hyphomicrobiaceae bacterium]